MIANRWGKALLALAAPYLLSLPPAAAAGPAATPTTTPIKYLVVIFQENNSFDHYFGTYPQAVNPPGEPPFQAFEGTPSINGLNGPLLTNNPNVISRDANNNPIAPHLFNPFRLDRSMAVTCDNDNAYDAEQEAYDRGLADQFQASSATINPNPTPASPPTLALPPCPPGLNMGYYDGNTVTALWNYAQRFAMSDSFFDAEFGTTVMGHLNLISGQTHQTNTATLKGKIANGSVIANIDPDPSLDDCASGSTVKMSGHNIGDLLNAKGVTWGWFYGDFTPAKPAVTTGPTPSPAVCTLDYDSHYDPFLYYPQTANPHHLPPSSIAAVGHSGDPANHQYSLATFWSAVAAHNLPAVSYLKAPLLQNGHPAKSDPLDEQIFLVETINQLQTIPEWSQMAIIITYDDSDGWYDHVVPPIVNQSNDPNLDHLCGQQPALTSPFVTASIPLAATAFNDRCGYGQRLPMLVISPFAKPNYVDHTVTDTTSILRFIEDNWDTGRIDSLDHPNGTPTGDPPEGQASFDSIAGTITGMFDFDNPPNMRPVFLDPQSGEALRGSP
ncbi:MAG TPA: alkaline phosphatase family protein [Stellaceae bacterium]|nr:alkaline phosphatase family protein [Stellaceae bacterium]